MILFMDRNRIDQARAAYQTRNLMASRKAHTPQLIAHSIHREDHARTSLADVILGGQDGLVNVLGVVLGVAAASGDIRIIQAAGLAAAFAESVSMAAVAYTSTIAEAEQYQRELKREKWEIEHNPGGEKEEVRQIYIKRGFSGKLLDDVVEKITSNHKVWLEVMMSEELKLTPITKNEALISGAVVGVSAIIGSLIPLSPFFFSQVQPGIYLSLIFSGVTLFGVGTYKAAATVGNWYRSGTELTIIGLVSALVGYVIGALFKVPVVP